jgi:hypothetical protein
MANYLKPNRLATALPSLPQPSEARRDKNRSTRDLLADDPKAKAHLVNDDQFDHFLALIADGVRGPDALLSANMTRVGFEHVLRSNDAARARYEEAKIQALYKEFDLETIEGVLADVARGVHLNVALADRLLEVQRFYLLVLKDPLIRELYQDAQKIQAEIWAGEIISISDDDSHDVLTVHNEFGIEERANTARVNRDKLRSENRKWVMARVHHERFGDKKQIDLNANVTIDYAARLESARARKTQAKIS